MTKDLHFISFTHGSHLFSRTSRSDGKDFLSREEEIADIISLNLLNNDRNNAAFYRNYFHASCRSTPSRSQGKFHRL